jgi:hypothetical protein
MILCCICATFAKFPEYTCSKIPPKACFYTTAACLEPNARDIVPAWAAQRHSIVGLIQSIKYNYMNILDIKRLAKRKQPPKKMPFSGRGEGHILE